MAGLSSRRNMARCSNRSFVAFPARGLSMKSFDLVDTLLVSADRALRAVVATPTASRPNPARDVVEEAPLSDAERQEAAALMRVNHVGEVCAQALYDAQAFGTRDPRLKAFFADAAREESDHLAWTKDRIDALGGRRSLLNPVWYAGAFGIGLLAARLGDKVSLGFMAETERQVEQHLDGHMRRLPAADLPSRAIVEQMSADESHHSASAVKLGGMELPWAARTLMRMAARVMTTTAHRI
jgi:ubiquinone biosynthesis monooxygenase Coq7